MTLLRKLHLSAFIYFRFYHSSLRHVEAISKKLLLRLAPYQFTGGMCLNLSPLRDALNHCIRGRRWIKKNGFEAWKIENGTWKLLQTFSCYLCAACSTVPLLFRLVMIATIWKQAKVCGFGSGVALIGEKCDYESVTAPILKSSLEMLLLKVNNGMKTKLFSFIVYDIKANRDSNLRCC